MFNGQASSVEHDSGVGIHVQHLCMLTACASHLLTLSAEVGRSGGEVARKPVGCFLGIGLLSLLFLCVLLLLCFQMSAETSTSVVKKGGESVVRLLRNKRIDALSERQRHATQQRGCCGVAIERLPHCVDCSKNCVEL